MARKKRGFIGEDGREYVAVEKKPFYKKWWFWLLVIVLLFVFFTEDEEETNRRKAEEDTELVEDVEAEEDKPEEAEEKIAGIGETISVGDVDYTVNDIETATNVGGEWGKNSKGTFLIIDVTVANNGNESLRVSDGFFTLLNDDKEFESDGAAGIYANDEDSFFLASINPDLSLTGKVIFDVSDAVIDSETKQLQVQTGAWGTEKGLINLK